MQLSLHIPMKKRINMHFIPISLRTFLREKGSVSRRGTSRSSTRNYKNLYEKNKNLLQNPTFTLTAGRN